MRSSVAQDWVANIEVPIFKDGRPFRGLVVGIRHHEFLPLLSARDIPRNWLASIIDGQGRIIARVPQGAAQVGQLASQGWRATRHGTGLFEFPSLEGEPLIQANARPSVTNWTVGVAVKKGKFQAAAWSAVRWAIAQEVGFGCKPLSGGHPGPTDRPDPSASCASRLPTSPAEPVKPIAAGPPEFIELQDTLYRAAVERQKAAHALMGALSRVEHEMALREEAQTALAQSQRMEAVGQLAGGMAHDFNNVLAAISSYLDTVTLRSSDEKIREAVQGAMDAIEMGESLNRRLLSFSRRHGMG